MISTTLTKKSEIITHKSNETHFLKKILSTYRAHVAHQQRQKIIWYMLTIIMIPCVFMVLSILAMAQLTTNLEYYMGFTMLLFFANVSIHIVDAKSNVFVPLFYITSIILIGVPLMTYFIL